MKPDRTMLERIDEAIGSLDAAFDRARDTFEDLREGGGPALEATVHPEDRGPIVP